MKKFMIVLFFVLCYVALGFLDFRFITGKVSIDHANLWNWGWIIASLQLICFILSFRAVASDQKAALLLFGAPIYGVGSGLVFVPWLICSLKRISRLTFQMQIPGEPEEIDKSGDDEKGILLGKKVLPIRATTGSHEIVKNDPVFSIDPAFVEGDPLGYRMTLEPTAIIRFKVKDVVQFVRTIGSVTEAKRQLRDTAEAVIRNEFAMRTPALIIAHRTKIDEEIRKEIEKLVGNNTNTPDDESWGIDVDTAQLIDVDINKGINEALKKVATAKIAAVGTVVTATAEKEAAIEAGKGAASAELSMLTAQAEGKAKLAAIARTKSGRYAMALETAEKTVEKAQYSIVGADGLMGAIASAMETMKKIHSPDKAVEVKKGA